MGRVACNVASCSAGAANRAANPPTRKKPEEPVPLKLPVAPDYTADIFRNLDKSKDGKVELPELMEALTSKGCTEEMVRRLFNELDADGNGYLDQDELRDGLEKFGTKPEAPKSLPAKVVGAIIDFLNWQSTQTILYFVFVGVFQTLLGSLREDNEYFLDKHVADTFIGNHFDSSHNTLESVRRVPDIWEWGNNVLWPGLLGNLGPCGSEVGPLSAAAGGIGLAALASAKQCTDNVWPDGEGSFHLRGPTGYTVKELVRSMNVVDWTAGISIRQVRIKAVNEWPAGGLGDECISEIEGGTIEEADFGYNWTTGGATPLSHPWKFWTAEQLGGDPAGQGSASVASRFRTYPTSGFIAVVLPFFSTEFLPEQAGTAAEVRDFREVNVRRDTPDRQANFFCVRMSWNGDYIQQICDPNAGPDGPVPGGRITGVVRAAVEAFWNDMKRGHWIDFHTRFLHFTLQLRSNNIGTGSRVSLMFELTSAGGVLPSYDIETTVNLYQSIDLMKVTMQIALAMCIFFILLEAIELNDSGFDYFTDVWNLMDWLNFIVLILLYIDLVSVVEAVTPEDQAARCAGSELCTNIGYFDEWYRMRITASAKRFMAICASIQLLKVIKFLNGMIPKTELAVSVLKTGLTDMSFFALTFFISLFAFSNMFYVQLGPVMETYSSQLSSFIALFRALYGDFDVDDILNNSNSYLNLLLFLAYLFFAIFIMLSIFLTILGESQGKTSVVLAEKKETDEEYREYGVISHASDAVSSARNKFMEKFASSSSVAQYAMRHLSIVATDNRIHPSPGPSDDEDIPQLLADLIEQQKEMAELIEQVMQRVDKSSRPPTASKSETVKAAGRDPSARAPALAPAEESGLTPFEGSSPEISKQ